MKADTFKFALDAYFNNFKTLSQIYNKRKAYEN